MYASIDDCYNWSVCYHVIMIVQNYGGGEVMRQSAHQLSSKLTVFSLSKLWLQQGGCKSPAAINLEE